MRPLPTLALIGLLCSGPAAAGDLRWSIQIGGPHGQPPPFGHGTAHGRPVQGALRPGHGQRPAHSLRPGRPGAPPDRVLIALQMDIAGAEARLGWVARALQGRLTRAERRLLRREGRALRAQLRRLRRQLAQHRPPSLAWAGHRPGAHPRPARPAVPGLIIPPRRWGAAAAGDESAQGRR